MRYVRVVGALLTALTVLAAIGLLATQSLWSDRPPLDASDPAALSAQVQAPSPSQQQAQVTAQEPAGPPRVDEAWAADNAAKAGIPLPAMRAYANAQLNEPEGCEVGWTTLAGIGWIESHHGTVDGRTLGADGHSSTPILGPALDGDPFAAIPATPETSAWHGDPDWDHAVGPMQFIPSTWSQWGVDGDGDGLADPSDIDDAAATAVAYLCADGHDLTSGAGWADAIFGYNHDDSYVANVHAAASEYAERTQ